MDRDFETLREEALALDFDSRVTLMEELASSLAEEDPFFEAQLDEAERRWESIVNGEAKLYSAEEVIAEARQRIKE
jgi:hypothetical protein